MIIENFKDDKEALRAMTGELVRYMDRKDDGLPFNLALSGGGTAQKMFALWVDEYKDKIDWDAIRFFWVDERCVPPTDPDSNYGHANELLFKPLHIPAGHVHRIHGEVEPGTEAMRYSRVVKEYLPRHGQLPYFDCIILGIGGDAHTASIFPDTFWKAGRLLILTTVSIGLAQLKPVQKLRGNLDLGLFISLTFLATIGFAVDLQQFIGSALMMTLYVLFMLIGCIVLHLIICRIFKIKYEYVILSMVGCIVDGPTSSLTAAGADWKSLINVGLIMGVIAGACGNYVGIFVSYVIKGICGL